MISNVDICRCSSLGTCALHDATGVLDYKDCDRQTMEQHGFLGSDRKGELTRVDTSMLP